MVVVALWRVLVDVDVERAWADTDVDEELVVLVELEEVPVDAAATETDELVEVEDARTKLVLVAVARLVNVVEDDLVDGVVAATVTRAVCLKGQLAQS